MEDATPTTIKLQLPAYETIPPPGIVLGIDPRVVFIVKWQLHFFWRVWELVAMVMDYLYDVPQQCLYLADILDSFQQHWQVRPNQSVLMGHLGRTPYRDWLLKELWAPKWNLHPARAHQILEIMEAGTRCVDCKGLLHDISWIKQNVPDTSSNGYQVSISNRRRAAERKGDTEPDFPFLSAYLFCMKDYTKRDRILQPARCFECVKKRVPIIDRKEAVDYIAENLRVQYHTAQGLGHRITQEWVIEQLLEGMWGHQIYQYDDDAMLNFGKKMNKWTAKPDSRAYFPLRRIQRMLDKLHELVKDGWSACSGCGIVCHSCVHKTFHSIKVEMIVEEDATDQLVVRGCFSNVIPWEIGAHPIPNPATKEFAYDGPFRKRIGWKRKAKGEAGGKAKKKKKARKNDVTVIELD